MTVTIRDVDAGTVPLRERKRRQVMREVQVIAVRHFAARGFSSVTVEEIAADSDIAPITIYRYFGTKERLVLWDEFDPPILEEIGKRLPDTPPLQAVRMALSSLLDEVYDREGPMALARAALIQAEPALMAAAAVDSRAFAAAIAQRFESTGMAGFAARVTAESAVAALRVAVDEWQRRHGKVPLADLIGRAFDVLQPGAET